jgi:hypothetical protein
MESRSYIEQVAGWVWEKTGGEGPYPEDEAALWLGYAVLVLAKGKRVTSEDVHNAWSAWAAMRYDSHPSLIPFDELSVEVQHLDDSYRDAIRSLATSGSAVWHPAMKGE